MKLYFVVLKAEKDNWYTTKSYGPYTDYWLAWSQHVDWDCYDLVEVNASIV